MPTKIIKIERCDLCRRMARGSKVSAFILPFSGPTKVCDKCISVYFCGGEQINKYRSKLA